LFIGFNNYQITIGCSIARELTLAFSVAKHGMKVIKDNRGRIYRTGGCVILEKSADVVCNTHEDIFHVLFDNFTVTKGKF